jgi:hypothetical protein
VKANTSDKEDTAILMEGCAREQPPEADVQVDVTPAREAIVAEFRREFSLGPRLRIGGIAPTAS